MNRSERRRLGVLLGVPPEWIVGYRTGGWVEICPEGACTEHEHVGGVR